MVEPDRQTWDVGLIREALQRSSVEDRKGQRILARDLQAAVASDGKWASQRHPLQSLVPPRPAWHIAVERPDGIGARISLDRMLIGPHTAVLPLRCDMRA